MDETRLAALTPREREIMEIAAEGIPPKVIAQRLNLSERTVYRHLTSASRTLGYGSTGEATTALARFMAIGPFEPPMAISAPHVLTLPAQLVFVIDLFLPELTGRRTNDLSIPHRLLIIISRALLVALTCLAAVAVVQEVGRAIARFR